LRMSGSPNFQRPLAAKLASEPEKFWRCKNALEVLYHLAKFGGTRISAAAGVAKTLSLFVCLVVTLLNVRGCAKDFVTKALEYRNDLIGECL